MLETEPKHPELLPEDIESLSREVEKRQAHPEKPDSSPREIVKESLRASFLTPSTSETPSVPAENHLPDYLSTADPALREEVNHLVELAFSRGINKAVAEARRSATPFILDAFHDALVDKVYPELLQRGVIKE